MIILGLSDSHESHACLLRDGELIAAIGEERLSRLKADMGYPKRSIDSVLEMAGVAPEEVDYVAFSERTGNLFAPLLNANAIFSVKDWIEQCREYWGPVLIDGAPMTIEDGFNLFKDRNPALADDPYFPFLEKIREQGLDHIDEVGNAVRRQVVQEHLGLCEDQILAFRHEDCHKAYGFWSNPNGPAEALILTMEGGGDDSSATLSTVDKNGDFIEHWRSNDVMLGRLYRYVTLILGMMPGQHEFKVMGLAPYGTEYHGKRSLEFFRKIHDLDGIEIHKTGNVRDMYFSVKEALEGERFDGIAWGLQTYVEELLSEWVSNAVEQFGIRNVIFSGGVAQNIKACKSLVELPNVDQFWVGPISGDGSLGLGAAWLAHREKASDVDIVGLPTVYLGTSYDAAAQRSAIDRHDFPDGVKLIDNPSHADVAQWLGDGMIVARYSGRMEFGQRALGNRSILADPRRAESVEIINNQIKYRDFWMPFTPSMMIEEADRLIENPKQIYSPFMTMAFDLKPEFKTAIPAAQHPADKTVRPQMLRREDNPGYYDLMSAFKDRTGLGVIMNTSFNMHGDAIVETPDQAIATFLKSELDVLLFDDIALMRS